MKFRYLGATHSCGCYQHEVIVKMRTTHGLSGDRRAMWLWQTYKLLPGDYDRLYDLQLGRCAICLRTLAEGQRLAVDHDHATGRVRGLLCRPCNNAIGLLQEDVGALARAIQYLSPNQERSLITD